jgi:hypothetical protein
MLMRVRLEIGTGHAEYHILAKDDESAIAKVWSRARKEGLITGPAAMSARVVWREGEPELTESEDR